jgi:Zn-finger protein
MNGRCQLCYCRVNKETGFRLCRDDGDKIWLCRHCFDKPVEEFFYTSPGKYEKLEAPRDV